MEQFAGHGLLPSVLRSAGCVLQRCGSGDSLWVELLESALREQTFSGSFDAPSVPFRQAQGPSFLLKTTSPRQTRGSSFRVFLRKGWDSMSQVLFFSVPPCLRGEILSPRTKNTFEEKEQRSPRTAVPAV